MIIGMVQPFAVHGVSTLFAKYDRNPVAYNRERGLLLQKEYRHWIWLNYLLHFFAEREVAGCVFLTSVSTKSMRFAQAVAANNIE